MKRIVLSGAGGFLGSHIIKCAAQALVPVLAVTSNTESAASLGVEAVETDVFLNDAQPLSEEDVFVNAMFPTNADGFRMAAGLQKTYAVIRAAHGKGAGSVINISSQSVYAVDREEAAKETDALCLDTPYATGKYGTEAFCDAVFDTVPHSNLRLASLIGVGYEQRIINRMVTKALAGEELQVQGGMQRYGFLDVRDAAAGIVRMSQTDAATWKPVYNLGPSDSVTLTEIAQMIVGELQAAGRTASYRIMEGSDRRNSALCADLFRKDFDWQPGLSVAQTIRDIVQDKLQGAS